MISVIRQVISGQTDFIYLIISFFSLDSLLRIAAFAIFADRR